MLFASFLYPCLEHLGGEVMFSSIECYSLLGNSAVVLGVYVFRLHTVFFSCILLVVRFVNFFFLLILLFFTLH